MSFLKNMVPKKMRVLAKLSRVYLYDFRRFAFNSNVYQTFDTESKLKGKLTIYYHVVEKGLTMPETRLGFGQPVVQELVKMLEMYIHKGYDQSKLEFLHSINVLEEYEDFHKAHDYELEAELVNSIDRLKSKIKRFQTCKQLEFERNEFFSLKDAPFDQFCLSRHSSRNYSDKQIPLEILQNCVRLALKSPSSCNRQLNRIYMVRDTKMKEEVLKLQNGNRGFGHLADTLFVITADISVFQGPNDRNESYINSGMFAMSLMYALHRNEIGSCPLNWSVEVERDVKLRKLLGIPENERVGLVISCGYLPDRIRIASSPRLPLEDVIKTF